MNEKVARRINERLNALEEGRVRLRLGVVVDDDPLTVTIAGSSTEIPAATVAGVHPAVDQVVSIATFGADLLILGAVADGARGWSAGDLKATARPAAEPGWHLCDGASLLRVDEPALFAAIGTTYGAADGTHFNVPDLRGRVPVGVDGAAGRIASSDALGQAGGAATHTLMTAEIPAHTHPTPGQRIDTAFAAGGSPLNGWNAPTVAGDPTGATGGGGAHNNLPPYQVVNYLIKL